MPTSSPPAAVSADHRLAGVFGPVLPLLGSMASLCIGSSFAKSLFPVAGAAGMTALRNGLSALLMLALFRPWRRRVGWREVRAAALYGVVIGGMNLCFYMALRTLPIGIAIAVEFSGPLGLAVILSARRLDLLWIGCAAAGVGLLALPGTGGAPIDPVGVGFALAAAFGWAMYILAGKRASELIPGPQAVSLGLCVAAVVTVPFGVATAGRALLAPSVLASGVLVAVLCSALPYPLEMLALRRLPRHVFGVVLSLEPAIGALAALAILGERLGLVQWIAIGAVVIASCGITLTRPAEQVPQPL